MACTDIHKQNSRRLHQQTPRADACAIHRHDQITVDKPHTCNLRIFLSEVFASYYQLIYSRLYLRLSAFICGSAFLAAGFTHCPASVFLLRLRPGGRSLLRSRRGAKSGRSDMIVDKQAGCGSAKRDLRLITDVSGGEHEDDYDDFALPSINPAGVTPRLCEMHVEKLDGGILKKLGDNLLCLTAVDYVGADQHVLRIERTNR